MIHTYKCRRVNLQFTFTHFLINLYFTAQHISRAVTFLPDFTFSTLMTAVTAYNGIVMAASAASYGAVPEMTFAMRESAPLGLTTVAMSPLLICRHSTEYDTGVLNTGSSVQGPQYGVLNTGSSIQGPHYMGPQYGVLNTGPSIRGPQYGVLNTGSSIWSPQYRALNTGSSVRSPQYGVLNTGSSIQGPQYRALNMGSSIQGPQYRVLNTGSSILGPQ